MNTHQDAESWQHQDQLNQQEKLIGILVGLWFLGINKENILLLASSLGLSKEFKQAIEV